MKCAVHIIYLLECNGCKVFSVELYFVLLIHTRIYSGHRNWSFVVRWSEWDKPPTVPSI